MADTYQTQYTLLSRIKLGVNADEAREEFAAIYRPFVIILLRSMNIRWEDQEDIAQEVMVKILNNLEQFNGNAKFRTWMMSVVRNTAYSHMGRQKRRFEREQTYAKDHDEQDMSQDLFDKLYQKKWESYICTLAYERIKPKFTGKAIHVFDMTMKEHDVDYICRKLDLKRNTVYRLRTRVKTAMIDEVARLRQQMELK